ncbi:hypothetical protein BP00DRAFT_177476 [Aspergillus indologenus CBS 114.80]|uniref:Uncharacterized protein n=1 Tax=Aspergillus indologenus CBS 114.80 TaxID=1450541 RepID=A0A2V5J2G7_9EURO|nr:hypothetical protein BP00DRAFT_177476 [Aspergillus indologenus CBS 114.80]
MTMVLDDGAWRHRPINCPTVVYGRRPQSRSLGQNRPVFVLTGSGNIAAGSFYTANLTRRHILRGHQAGSLRLGSMTDDGACRRHGMLDNVLKYRSIVGHSHPV